MNLMLFITCVSVKSSVQVKKLISNNVEIINKREWSYCRMKVSLHGYAVLLPWKAANRRLFWFSVCGLLHRQWFSVFIDCMFKISHLFVVTEFHIHGIPTKFYNQKPTLFKNKTAQSWAYCCCKHHGVKSRIPSCAKWLKGAACSKVKQKSNSNLCRGDKYRLFVCKRVWKCVFSMMHSLSSCIGGGGVGGGSGG